MADTDRETLARNLTNAVSQAISEAINATFSQASRNTSAARSAAAARPASVTGPTASPQPALEPAQRSQDSAHLPSAFSHLQRHTPVSPKRRRSSNISAKQKITNKNIICILKQDTSKSIPIPRGESRARLTEAGLTGKIAINSQWEDAEVRREISNLFASSFGLLDNELLPFMYLSTIPGGKKLCVPATSPSFKWHANEVTSTAAQGSLYIMAEIPPLLFPVQKPHNSDDECDPEMFEVQLDSATRDVSAEHEQSLVAISPSKSVGLQRVTENERGNEVLSTSSSSAYMSYVSLVDEDDAAVIVSSDEEELETLHSPEGPDRQLEQILRELRDNSVLFGKRSFINIRRKHVWEDASRNLLRRKFDPRAIISVKFADDAGSSEGAIDTGGPRREFLRLLIKAANEHSGIFQGRLDQRVLLPNATARSKGHYKLVGLILGWSLLHGGPGGNYLSKTIFNCAAFGIGIRDAEVDDIPDKQIREELNKVKLANTLEELNSLLEEESLKAVLEAQGHLLQASNVDQKRGFVKAIANHLLIDSVRYLLEEFIDGLKVMGVLQAIKDHPKRFGEVLCKIDRKIDATTVDLLFEVKLAEEGTNIRQLQERAVVYWRDFLQDCVDEESTTTLQHVLIFSTGLDVPPPLGFDNQPSLEFTASALPTANTCGVTLYIPIIHSKYEDFKEAMQYGILNSPCFGQP